MTQHTDDKNPNQADLLHELWLIYCRLKDSEADPDNQPYLLIHSRERLGHLLNVMHRAEITRCQSGKNKLSRQAI
jgi:hypothetical protein